MSQNKNLEPAPVPETSIRRRMEIPQKITQLMNFDYGVPDEYAREVMDTMAQTLEQSGIDPPSVVFSGYSGNAHERATEFENQDTEIELERVSHEANRLFSQGEFDANPQLRDDYQQRIAVLKEQRRQSRGVYSYFFNDFKGLEQSMSAYSNPIHYAGIAEGATIGVYEKEKLEALDPEGVSVPGDVWIIRAEPQEVDSALVFKFYPHYTDEKRQALR